MGRQKLKRTYRYTTQMVYRSLRLLTPGMSKIVSTQTLYFKILKTIFRKILYEIVVNNYVFKYGFFGSFQLFKYMPEIRVRKDGSIVTNKIVDVHKTIANSKNKGGTGEIFYFNNEKTGGYIYKLIWIKDELRFENHKHYDFKLMQQASASIAMHIPNIVNDAPIINFKV